MSQRYKLLGLIWLLMFVNYLDRVNISVAAPSMMKSLSIDPGTFGLVLSAFTIGYALIQIPGGALADRFGARLLLVAAPLLWSVFTGLTGLVETATALIAIRLCFGMAEGLSNSAIYKSVGDNFAPRERASANSIWITALAAGPASVAPLAAWALRSVGWEQMFLWFSLPGFVLAAVLWFAIPREEAARARLADTATRSPGWRWLLRRPSSWLIFFAYLAFNVGYWGYLGWMPSYLSLQRHLDIKALGVAASVPYVFGFAGILLFGWLGSTVLYRVRPLLIAAGYLCAAVSLYIAYTADTIEVSLAGLCGTAFFMYGGFGPYVSLVQELAPERERGAFAGFVNTGGQLGGVLAPAVIGWLVHATGSFNAGFGLMVGALAVSAGCYLGLAYALGRTAPQLVVAAGPLPGEEVP